MPALSAALTENVVVFAVNGALKRLVVAAGWVGADSVGANGAGAGLSTSTEMCLGAMSGFVSATAICPLEVLKCRLQVDRARAGGGAGPAGGGGGGGGGQLLRCAAELWRAEGAAGFFRGMSALWARE